MDAITKFSFFTQLNLNLCALLSFHFREGCFRKTGEAAPHKISLTPIAAACNF